jgi:hypothetical protein
MKTIPVLFCMPRTIYHTFPQCDVYDEARDAFTYPGGLPVIAHPPCRLWSRMKAFSTAPETEKQTAWFALDMVRTYGGVLEHPADSSFWKAANLPTGSQRDEYGGFTLVVDQHAFGHRARKRTWLYIVGIYPGQIPAYPISWELPTMWVTTSQKKFKKKSLGPRERSATPILFAEFLIKIIHEIHHARLPHGHPAQPPLSGAIHPEDSA